MRQNIKKHWVQVSFGITIHCQHLSLLGGAARANTNFRGRFCNNVCKALPTCSLTATNTSQQGWASLVQFVCSFTFKAPQSCPAVVSASFRTQVRRTVCTAHPTLQSAISTYQHPQGPKARGGTTKYNQDIPKLPDSPYTYVESDPRCSVGRGSTCLSPVYCLISEL